MSQRPVVFLSFANDDDAHLAMLKEEGRDLFRALQDRHDQQHIEVMREESADIEEIFYNLNRYGSRVAMFHYGGHANGTQLRLEDQAAGAQGLARLLGSLENLKVVFLNGCSTQGQVRKLLEQGVPAVVATSVPINDRKAKEFATQFYQAMAAGNSLQKAFNQAMALMETRYENEVTQLGIVRSLVWDEEEEENNTPVSNSPIPWGLYLHDQKGESVLNWTLPDFKKVSLPANFGSAINSNYQLNDYIVTVLESMAEYNKKLYGEMEDEFGEERDKREYPEIIIKNFPWPIGSQIRILVANSEMMNQPSIPRLKQLLYTYVSTSQFLCYILLAELWDAQISGRISLDAEFQRTFGNIPTHVDAFDFIQLINLAREFFAAHDMTPFIPEFNVLFESLEQQDDTYTAYQFLESVRKRVTAEEVFTPEELPKLCNETEFCVAAFLKKVAFMARYRLVTVKDINIFKPRHKEALFRMQLGVLNAFDKELLRSREKDQAVFTDSHSVLVVRNLKDMTEYLNLSPFIIDKNAFAGKPVPNICLYHHREADGLVYLSVHYNINKGQPDPSDLFNTRDEPFNVLKEQFQMFTENKAS